MQNFWTGGANRGLQGLMVPGLCICEDLACEWIASNCPHNYRQGIKADEVSDHLIYEGLAD